MDFKNEYVLSVDLKKKMTKITPIFVQYDNASLIFKVFDNGQPFDLTGLTKATVTHHLPNGSKFTQNGALETLNNKQIIRYNYSGNEMAVTGIVTLTLSMFSGEQKVSIQPFKINIINNV